MKSYELWLHYKQGDEIAKHVEAAAGSLCDGLESYAWHLREAADVCMKLAERFKGTTITVQADTHMIAFEAASDSDRALLDELVEEGTIIAVGWDEDDEGAEGEEEEAEGLAVKAPAVCEEPCDHIDCAMVRGCLE